LPGRVGSGAGGRASAAQRGRAARAGGRALRCTTTITKTTTGETRRLASSNSVHSVRDSNAEMMAAAHAAAPETESPAEVALRQLELFVPISKHLGLQELGRLECTATFFGACKVAALDTTDPRSLVQEAAQLLVVEPLRAELQRRGWPLSRWWTELKSAEMEVMRLRATWPPPRRPEPGLACGRYAG
jgi:hypothetical protein